MSAPSPPWTLNSFHSCKKRCYCDTVCFLITFFASTGSKRGYLAPSLLCPPKVYHWSLGNFFSWYRGFENHRSLALSRNCCNACWWRLSGKQCWNQMGRGKNKWVGVNPQASPGTQAQYFASAAYLGTGPEPPSQGLVGGETSQTRRQSL